MFWQLAAGGTLSSMVTVAVQLDELTLKALTVKVTVLGPISVQSKSVISSDEIAMPQASVEPLSTCPAVIVAVPKASSCTVMFWQLATGAILSSTVTVAVQVEVFPFTSVTVRVIVLGPTLLQSKALISSVEDVVPQASVEPLSISAAVIEALPVASNCIVMPWQLTTGLIVSITVTAASQVAVLPLTSVTVSVTVFTPTSAQVKVNGKASRLKSIQLSLEPLSMSNGSSVALPVASR